MTGFTAIDLSKLPAPDIVETLSYETILAAMKADLQARDPAFTDLLESDPAMKVLEVVAFRELLIRQRVNDAARGVMLAFATGNDLDQLGGLYGVARQIVTPANPAAIPPIAAVYESDERFRQRIQLSLEGFSTAGPVGAYIFHALSASPLVKSVGVTSPDPGEVLVTILSTAGTGVPTSPLLATVTAALSAENVRPLTDQVTVQAVTLINYSVAAELRIAPGPDVAVVLAAALASGQAYTEAQNRIGGQVTVSGLHAALTVEGVLKVDLGAFTTDIEANQTQAPRCTGLTVAEES
jgi:phage-related baseplate assembly protein